MPEERLTLGAGWIDETPGFPTADQVPTPPPVVTLPTMSSPPVVVPPLPPPLPVNLPPHGKQRRAGVERPERPDAVIREANGEALVTPSRKGYFGASAVQRYLYQPGKVYLIISSPSHPTTILLPLGERLAAAPIIDGEAWDVGAAEMGSEATRSEAVILRPVKAGLESTMPLLTQGGRAYFCRLRSQEATGMIAVTWELPTVQVITAPSEPQGQPRSLKPQGVSLAAPVIALDRLHTAYSIEVIGKQRPPWVPIQVFDDGTKSYICFKESLGFTAAPAVFGVHADRSPAIVEFTPYTGARGDLTYIVQGLYPELRLRGTDTQEVKIVRGANGR